MSSTMPSSGKFILVAKAVALPGKEEKLKELLKAIRDRALSDAEPGTLSYRVNFDDSTGAGLLFEEYASPEAYGEHVQAQEFQTFIATQQSEGLFQDPLDVKYYQEI